MNETETRPLHYPKPWHPKSCKGWNFHVWSLGSDRCTMCGRKRATADV